MTNDIFTEALKQSSILKNHNYQIIRYYPYIASDEYFNIGIKVDEDYILLSDEHLEKFLKCSFIDKKLFIKHLEAFKEEYPLSRWYGEYIRLSERKSYTTDKSEQELLKILYEKYIGYKFVQNTKIKTKTDEIKELTIKVINDNFKNILNCTNSDRYYDLILKNTKKHKTYMLFIGSLLNDSDIDKVFKAYINVPTSNLRIYGYTNNEIELSANSKKRDRATIAITKFETIVKNFSNEENIFNSIVPLVA